MSNGTKNPPGLQSIEPPAWHANVKFWTIVLVSVGVGWRLLRYFLQFPIWGDEAFVCLNFVDRDYFELLNHLRYRQIVPYLYLAAELTVYHWLGPSELAMRLVSLVAGLGSIVLFWRLCRRVLSPLGCMLAVGILAVSYFPVRHSCEVKAYAFDLFCSLTVLVPAVYWLGDPTRLRHLAILAVVAPFAVTASYPTLFVAGAITLVLLPTVYRQPNRHTRSLFELYNVLMLGAFAMHFLVVGKAQVGEQGGDVQQFYHHYWQGSFPPTRLLDWPAWLLDIHTGDLFAYPVGGGNFGSVLTSLLCVAGVVHFWRSRRWSILGLCLVPFALNLSAACLDRYPYGGVTRLCQHLAPAICLLAGAGAAALLEALVRTPRWQLRATWAACGVLVVVAAAGLARDIRHPYKTSDEAWARRVANKLARDAKSGVPLIVMNLPDVKPTLLWYLDQKKKYFVWKDEANWRELGEKYDDIWCYHYSVPNPTPAEDFAQFRPRCPGNWKLVSFERDTSHPDYPDDPPEHWEMFHWKKGE
jgi:hypothetical protein